jgi:hypothetical protein
MFTLKSARSRFFGLKNPCYFGCIADDAIELDVALIAKHTFLTIIPAHFV